MQGGWTEWKEEKSKKDYKEKERCPTNGSDKIGVSLPPMGLQASHASLGIVILPGIGVGIL
jgi:hypothetical protein